MEGGLLQSVFTMSEDSSVEMSNRIAVIGIIREIQMLLL